MEKILIRLLLSDLGLHYLSTPFWQATRVPNFSNIHYTVKIHWSGRVLYIRCFNYLDDQVHYQCSHMIWMIGFTEILYWNSDHSWSGALSVFSKVDNHMIWMKGFTEILYWNLDHTDKENCSYRFLFPNQNICCGYSKEPSQWDGSFEHQKYMLKPMCKKIFTIFAQNFCLSKLVTLWTSAVYIIQWFLSVIYMGIKAERFLGAPKLRKAAEKS